MGHEAIVPLDLRENSARFGASKDHGNFRWSFGAVQIDELELSLKHLLVKKK